MKLNQNGFSLVEGLLIFIAISLVGFIGYYVYDKNSKDDPTISNSPPSQSENTPVDQKTQDETESWKEVKSANNKFTIRVPDGWILNNDPDKDILFGAPQTSDLTFKKGESATINSTALPQTDTPYRFTVLIKNKSAIDNDYTESSFTLKNGVEGTKGYIEYEDQLGGTGLSKTAIYEFEKNENIYSVQYLRLQGDPDYTEIVEKAIKTLDF